MRYATLPLLAGISLAAISCTDRSPVAPSLDAGVAAATVTTPGTGPWAKVVEGETGPGSLYALYIPSAENWNGDVVYYSHGIRPPLDPIALGNQNNFVAVREALGAQGYAFAYSSYSENGLAIKDGAQRTHQLRGLLNSQLPGKPQRNYLAGHSLGALVALDLAERFPGQYDGVLAMCGMIGGTPLEVQYVADVRALFDAYYPGALPGNAISVPTQLTLGQIQAAVFRAITPTAANPLATLKMFAIASTAQTPLAYKPDWTPADASVGIASSPAFRNMVESLITALYYHNLGTPDVVDRIHGQSPYDNRNTTYTMGTPAVPSAALIPTIQSLIAGANQTVARYDMPPDAQSYLEKYYVPTGRLTIPVVSIHNSWDPLVPYFHEPAFAQAASSAGALDLLAQLPRVDTYGHCNFSTPFVVSSFEALVDWVKNGNKPVT
jgi:pimeloyl-ACP methyl ester carboxylesterase